MTVTVHSLDSQIECLKRSMLTLGAVCWDLSLVPELSDKLDRLSRQISAPASHNTPSLGLGAAMELLYQARASLNLLTAAGYPDQREGDGLYSRLRSTLDDLETELGKELRREASALVFGLYVIIDPEVTGGRDPLEVARGALDGGARLIQLRDKLSEKGHTLPLARALKELCARYNALFIVNDHADLAVAVGADGLHVGQGDLPLTEARRLLAPHQIIGRSNHLPEEVLESQAQGADHVALGAVYSTATKPSIAGRATTGPEAVRKVKEMVNVPLVAIGGINLDNVEPVVRAGAEAICVTSAVGLAREPEVAARHLVEGILRAGGKA